MTVVLALKGEDNVVVAADSMVHFGDDNGRYLESRCKLRTINGSWVIGVSHSSSGLEAVDDLGPGKLPNLNSFDRLAVQQIASKLLERHNAKNFSEEAWFVLAGVGEFGAFIHTFAFKPTKETGVYLEGPQECPNQVALGASRHGALYFAYEFHRSTMTIPQRILTAFHSVAEIAKHDLRVARPINVAVVTKGQVCHYSEDDLVRFVERSSDITSTVSRMLTAEGLELP